MIFMPKQHPPRDLRGQAIPAAGALMRFIDEHKDVLQVTPICRVPLGMSRDPPEHVIAC